MAFALSTFYLQDLFKYKSKVVILQQNAFAFPVLEYVFLHINQYNFRLFPLVLEMRFSINRNEKQLISEILSFCITLQDKRVI